MHDLGNPGAFANVSAYSINSAAQVVGGADQGVSIGHAWLWQDGQMIDLNDRIPQHSGWVLMEARAINDLGQISGNGLVGDQQHAFLLTPTQ